MDYNSIKHNPEAVSKSYTYVADRCVVTKPVRVLFPERWIAKDLAEMGDVVHLIGYFCVIDGSGNYGVVSIPAVIRTSPDRISKTSVNGDTYMVLEYDKGSNLITNMNVVRDDNLVYYIYSEFLEKARIPFYFDMVQVSKFFDETAKYNGFTLGYDPAALEYLVGFMFRDPDDIGKPYRLRDDAKKNLSNVAPVVIGLNDVTTGSNNFITKVTKSYTTAGITSALNNPATRAERIETMLRNTAR